MLITVTMSSVYEPLDKNSNEIRLLRILPNSDPEAIVEVEVFKRTLAEAVKDTFIPFSYVWGVASQQTTIIVKSKPKSVGKNLAAMLTRARNVILRTPLKNDPRKHGYLFWADALCINQSNIEERNHQVSLMRHIYGSARLVLSWLGDLPDCDKALELIRATYLEWHAKPSEVGDERRSTQAADLNVNDWMSRYPEFWRADGEADIGGSSNSYWNAVNAIFTLPYWERLWIFQEMILPKRVMFMLGSTILSFDSLDVVCNWLELIQEQNHPPLVQLTEVWLDLYAKAIMMPHDLGTVQNVKQRALKPSIKTILPLVQKLKATDARDYLYGVYGLLESADQWFPDYSLCTAEVFLNFALDWWYGGEDTNFLLWAAGNLPVSPAKLTESTSSHADCVRRRIQSRHGSPSSTCGIRLLFS